MSLAGQRTPSSTKGPIRKKRIMVFYVGGDIGLQKNERGAYILLPNAIAEFLKKHVAFNDPDTARKYFGTLQDNQLVLPQIEKNVILYEIIEYKPLIDSANIGPKEWARLAEDVGLYYDSYDGFLILHGLDTLAYTSSALSFMLEGLQKAVIFTGSQIPLFEARSDGRDNILHSLILAACYRIPEVCVYFHYKLMRGNRIINYSCESFDCYLSRNYPYLAEVAIDITVNEQYIRPVPKEAFKVNTSMSEHVVVIQFVPTLSMEFLKAIVKSSCEGVVLCTYGAGNLPKSADLQKTLKWFIQNGITAITVTQCMHGTVNATYETGKWLKDIGCACGRDMTVEAATAKLCHVLGYKYLSLEDKLKMMETDLRGEMSPP